MSSNRCGHDIPQVSQRTTRRGHQWRKPRFINLAYFTSFLPPPLSLDDDPICDVHPTDKHECPRRIYHLDIWPGGWCVQGRRTQPIISNVIVVGRGFHSLVIKFKRGAATHIQSTILRPDRRNANLQPTSVQLVWPCVPWRQSASVVGGQLKGVDSVFLFAWSSSVESVCGHFLLARGWWQSHVQRTFVLVHGGMYAYADDVIIINSTRNVDWLAN